MSRPATTAAINIIERNRLWSLLLPATVCLTDGSCAIWRHTQGSIIIISCIAIFLAKHLPDSTPKILCWMVSPFFIPPPLFRIRLTIRDHHIFSPPFELPAASPLSGAWRQPTVALKRRTDDVDHHQMGVSTIHLSTQHQTSTRGAIYTRFARFTLVSL